MPKKQKKGLFVGKPHSKGGIPSEVKETGQQIEIEGDEYYICKSAYNSSKKYSFKNKSNKQILDKIYTEHSCKLNQSVMSAGDFIVCKLVVKDTSKEVREGTIKDIVNEMQGEKACKVENRNSKLKSGGEIETRTIKRKDGTIEEVKVYSEEELNARSQKKKKSLKNLAQNISKLRRVVNKDLKSSDEKKFLTALSVYIMLETSERVGNSESAKNGHYGITGLRKDHIKVSGNKVTFTYTGKSGVEHNKVVRSKRLADLIQKAINISPENNLLVTSSGFSINNAKVNRYLKDMNVTAKDIRGYSANNWVVSKLKRLNPENKDSKRKKQFNSVIKEVAEKVGHGAPTLKKHYLLPEIQIDWVNSGKVTNLANFKPKKLKFGGKLEEDTKQRKGKGGLAKGTKVEMEHSDTIEKLSTGKYTKKEGAKLIAKDHLKESDEYYDQLEKMEERLKNKVAVNEWFKGALKFLNW